MVVLPYRFAAKGVNGTDAHGEISRIFDKSILKEEKLAGGVVRFIFNLLMAGGRQSLLVVSQHRAFVPGNEAVSHLVRLSPSLFWLGQVAIDQNSHAVRQI